MQRPTAKLRAARTGVLAGVLTASLFVAAASVAGGIAGAASSSPSSDAAAAQKFLKPYDSIAKGIGITTPLKKAPASGKTLVYLQCEQVQCAAVEPQYAAAAKAVGWHLTVLNFQSTNPATFTAALNNALQYDPVGVAFVALLPYALWSSEVPKYQSAGVVMLPLGGVDVPAKSPVVLGTLGAADARLDAKILSEWVTASSGGDGNALLWSIPQLPAGTLIQNAFTADMKKECSACSVKVVDSSIPDVEAGKAPAEIVSAAQTDPGLKYIAVADIQLAPGLKEALKVAGITGVKIGGNTAGKIDEAAVQSGQESAVTPSPDDLAAWLSVDAAIRHSEGMTIPSVITPTQLLTAATMASTGVVPSDDYPYPANYQKLFKRLWKVG